MVTLTALRSQNAQSIHPDPGIAHDGGALNEIKTGPEPAARTVRMCPAPAALNAEPADLPDPGQAPGGR